MTTIITSTMVRIRIGSKIGTPKRSGVISANQSAEATFSKCIMPSEAVTMPPITMPSRTAMLARKPLPNLDISRIDARTIAEITMPDTGA